MRRIDREHAALRAVQIRLQEAADLLAEEIDRIDQKIASLEPNAIGEAAARVDVDNPDDAVEHLAQTLSRSVEAQRKATVFLESLV